MEDDDEVVGCCADEEAMGEDVVRGDEDGQFEIEGDIVFEDAREEVEGGGTSGEDADMEVDVCGVEGGR